MPVTSDADQKILRELIQSMWVYGSPKAKWILEHFNRMLPRFVKVFPHEYQRVLAQRENQQAREGFNTPVIPANGSGAAEVLHG